jgi:hypothetical protein
MKSVVAGHSVEIYLSFYLIGDGKSNSNEAHSNGEDRQDEDSSQKAEAA